MSFWDRDAERGPVATGLIGTACVLVYILSLQVTRQLGAEDAGVTPSPLALVRLGAVLSPLVRAGEWWRTVTAVFLHGDILHIIMNGMGLWVVGTVAEARFGRARLFVVFIVAGTVGETVTALWNAQVLSVGASGGIFGLIALCVVNAIRRRDRDLRARFLPWLIYGLAIGFLGGGRIDNAAHVGGLAAGALLGLFVGEERRPSRLWTVLAFAALALVAVAFVLAAQSHAYEIWQ